MSDLMPAPPGSPWPVGHGLLRQATAVCACGMAILECQAMDEWAAGRRATVADGTAAPYVPVEADTGFILDLLAGLVVDQAASTMLGDIEGWRPIGLQNEPSRPSGPATS